MLESLDADRLRAFQCWFGGGTAIALLHGEYRESVDIDFMVSDLPSYRLLRQAMPTGTTGLAALLRADAESIATERPVRTDQYGIRTMLLVDGVPIKFEIILEGRIPLQMPGRSDAVSGIATLAEMDLAATKLLANVDRWADDSVFGRDAIDLAMMDLPPRRLRPAVDKAAVAYGNSVTEQMLRAIDAFGQRDGWLLRCTRAMSINVPAAAVQSRLRALRRRLLAL